MSAPPVPGDAATISVSVAVSVEEAFDFTREIDLWWRHGRKYRIAGRSPGRLTFESKPDGRLFETFEQAGKTHTFEVGRIVRWQPPHALDFVWRGVNFKPDEKTMVEVSFTAMGESTLVRLRHSGWSGLPAEHPARHGQQGAEFVRTIGLWWGELLSALREHVQSRQEEAMRTEEPAEGQRSRGR